MPDSEGGSMKRSHGRAAIALVTLLIAPLAIFGNPPAVRADAPAGQVTWAVSVSLPPALFDAAEATGTLIPFSVYYALHDALAKPMPGKSMTPSLAESWTVSPD